MKVYLLLVFLCSVNGKINNYNDIINSPIQQENKGNNVKYKPEWSDLDTRPLPEWYDKAKIGIFLHWGVFSVPSFHSEWFWNYWKAGTEDIEKFMNDNYPPGFTYQDFAPMFKAEFFDPAGWAKLFSKAGAKYIVLTTKHHEGFTLFPSKRSFSWNAVDVGPKVDLVGELSQAIRDSGMKFGVYHSLYEWYNPIYEEDHQNKFRTRTYPDIKLWPDIKQLVNDYRPSVIWADGDWEAPDTYWNSTSLLAWLYNDSPIKNEVVVNDRWGKGIPCHHGDFYNCDDRYNPGKLQNHKWENAFTIDRVSWGYRRNMQITDVLTIDELLQQIVSTVSCGGNALINVGPTKEGTIAPIFQERLLSLGKWLGINGEAVYATSPWKFQNDSLSGYVWYTCKKTRYNAAHPTAKPRRSDTITAIYATTLKWPANNLLRLKDVTSYLHTGNYQVQLLGNEGFLDWKIKSGVVFIQFPDRASVDSENAWSLKFIPK